MSRQLGFTASNALAYLLLLSQESSNLGDQVWTGEGSAMKVASTVFYSESQDSGRRGVSMAFPTVSFVSVTFSILSFVDCMCVDITR